MAIRLMARSWCLRLYLPEPASNVKLCFDSTEAESYFVSKQAALRFKVKLFLRK